MKIHPSFRLVKKSQSCLSSALFAAAFAALLIPNALFAANTLLVNKTLDSNDGSCDVVDCSLREAMAAADFGDTIEFSALFNTPQTIALNGTNLAFSGNVTLKGPGRNLLAISGMQQSRAFLIPLGFAVFISDLTVRDGMSDFGGGISAEGFLDLQNVSVLNSRAAIRGGGIAAFSGFNFSGVIVDGNQSEIGGGLAFLNNSGGFVRDSRVSNNSVDFLGGGIHNDRGNLTVIASTISANSVSIRGAVDTSGGVDNNDGTFELRNSTISGNRTAVGVLSAGGLWSSGPTKIFDSTITDNTVPVDTNTAAGIVMTKIAGTLIIRNSIVASNSHLGSTREIFFTRNAPAPISQGFNLIGDPGNAIFNGSFDQVGTTALPLNPMLLPLANNGGATLTHALQAGSPALDRGSSFGLTRDQRGSVRPFDDPNIVNAADGADIGAYEAFRDSIFQNGFEGRPE
jgi:CSLREA domain-containing protein